MAHASQLGRLAYLFDDDTHSSGTTSSGNTALPPADAIKQAIHALQAFQKTKNRDYINEAVELAQQAADSTPSGDENLAGYLTTLGAMHQHHYKAVGDRSNIDCAVVAARRAVEVSRDDDDNQDLYIRDLSAALGYRYSESRDKKHLDEAIFTMKQMEDSLGSKNRNRVLMSLLGFQKLSFEKTSDTGHLDDAISTTNLLLDQVDGSGRVELLYNLCDLYDMYLDQLPTAEHLEECIRICRDTLEAIPTEDDRRPAIMHNISVYYTRLYSQDGRLGDLRQAIEFNQMASKNTEIKLVQRRTSLLEGLAQKFMLWYEKEGGFPALDESILDRHLDGNKADAKDQPEKATWLFMLSRHLEEKVRSAEPSNDILDDLELSIFMVYEALEATAVHHPNWEDMVNALRKRQRLWSECTGKIPDTPEIATLLFRKGGRWIAPELAEDHDLHDVPYCIMIGDLDATGDEAGKQPVVQCLTAPSEVKRDHRHTLVQI
ncbi:hypothetical protein LA080_002078 [Diaporthe eres]|nr:hypothetical protein LA080_002078 [Diaporthe eres]